VKCDDDDDNDDEATQLMSPRAPSNPVVFDELGMLPAWTFFRAARIISFCVDTDYDSDATVDQSASPVKRRRIILPSDDEFDVEVDEDTGACSPLACQEHEDSSDGGPVSPVLARRAV
jgi:hypothetical protein